MHNFVNFHVLISHSPSCLNRDDMNMQKSAIFGGVRRVRISSQSLKRAIRFSDYYRRQFGEPSVRTRSLDLLKCKFAEKLKNEFDSDIVGEAINLFVKAKAKAEKAADAETEAAKEDVEENVEEETGKQKDGKGVAVAPWVLAEIRLICAAVKEVRKAGLSDEELKKIKEKFAKQKGNKKKTEEQLEQESIVAKIEKVMSTRTAELQKALAVAIDIALSGRMATTGLMTPVDGALAIAHAITTHAVDSDIDWFTAVDDLVSDAGETGAAHLNTQEFASGVFYRHASLNLGQLQANLGGAPRQKALEIAGHIAHLLATVVPDAKQQSFAAHNPADAVLVALSDLPLSLANAFEAPVRTPRGGGLREPSQQAMFDYWTQVHRGYGLEEKAAAFVLDPERALPEGVQRQITLADLSSWIARDGAV